MKGSPDYYEHKRIMAKKERRADYAAMAMQALISRGHDNKVFIAVDALAYADALLDQLEREV